MSNKAHNRPQPARGNGAAPMPAPSINPASPLPGDPPIGPVPTSIAVAHDQQNRSVVIRFATPTGPQCYVLTPDAAEHTATELVENARLARTGLTIAGPATPFPRAE